MKIIKLFSLAVFSLLFSSLSYGSHFKVGDKVVVIGLEAPLDQHNDQLKTIVSVSIDQGLLHTYDVSLKIFGQKLMIAEENLRAESPEERSAREKEERREALRKSSQAAVDAVGDELEVGAKNLRHELRSAAATAAPVVADVVDAVGHEAGKFGRTLEGAAAAAAPEVKKAGKAVAHELNKFGSTLGNLKFPW